MKRDYRKDYDRAINELVASMEREQAQRRVLLVIGTIAIGATAALGAWAAVEISRGVFPWIPVVVIAALIGHRVFWKWQIRRKVVKSLEKAPESP
jgi:uncharacterized membrane protein YfcA